MSGRWLLDAMILFGASKRVISRHVSLRKSQLDTYKKTSSLAKAIERQTSRVTLTAKAATVLSGRLNEHGSRYSTVPEKSRSTIQTPLSSRESVRGHSGRELNLEGLQQEHFYKRSEDNSTSQPVLSKSLDVQQEEAKETPLPDGTIPLVEGTDGRREVVKDGLSDPSQSATPWQPLATEEQSHALKSEDPSRSSILDGGQKMTQPRADKVREIQRQSESQIPAQPAEPPLHKASAQHGALPGAPELTTDQEKDVYYLRTSGSSPVLSSLPRVKLPKVSEATQASCDHVPDSGINQDVYYSSRSDGNNNNTLEVRAEQEKEPVSDKIYSEIFQSPRVAKLLSGKQKGSLAANSLNLDRTQKLDREKTKKVRGVDSDTSTNPNLMDGETEAKPKRQMPVALNSGTLEEDDDIRQPAANIAGEAQMDTSEAQNVRKSAPSAELYLLMN